MSYEKKISDLLYDANGRLVDLVFAGKAADAEIARLQAQVDALAGALQKTLYELWSDRHSHQDDEGFRSDFAEEYAALAAAGR